jgi:hypothetical protein
MEPPKNGASMDLQWWVAVIPAGAIVIGWVVAIASYFYARGKDRGAIESALQGLRGELENEKRSTKEERALLWESLKTDRAAFDVVLKEIRTEFQQAVRRFELAFVDQNGNPRLMTVNYHHEWCDKSQKLCGERFERLGQAQEKSDTNQTARDNEIFTRLRQLEPLPDRIEGLAKRLDEYITRSSSSRRDHERN